MDKHPQKILGPLWSHRWKDHTALIHKAALQVKQRPEGSVSAFDSAGSIHRLSAQEFFEKKKHTALQAINPGSWHLMNWALGNHPPNNETAPTTRVIWDFCAAPGGKLLATWALLSGKSHDKIEIHAFEAKHPRLLRLQENLKSWGSPSNIHTHLWAWGEDDVSKLHLMPRPNLALLDLPCSGSGTLASRPDLLSVDPQQRVEQVLPLQKSILRAAAPMKSKTGATQWIISLCSVDPQEVHAVGEQIQEIWGTSTPHPDYESWQDPDLKETLCEGLVAWRVFS